MTVANTLGIRGAAAWLLMGVILTGCEIGATDEERISRAQSALEDSDPATAVIELRNVLQNDPVNLQARLLLANAALLAGDAATAAKEFGRALELGASQVEVRRPYLAALVATRDYPAALEFSDSLDPAVVASDPEVLELRSRVLLETRQLDEAQTALDSALRIEPAFDPARITLAALELARGRADSASEILEQIEGSAGADARFWTVKGNLATARSEPAQAISAYEKAVELSQPDPYGLRTFESYARLGEAHLTNGDLDKARLAVNKILSRSRQHPLPNYLMARIELQSGHPEEALGHAQTVLTASPDSFQARLVAGAASLALGNPAQAQSYLAPAVADQPGSIPARQLLAQARLQLGQADEAVDLLSPALDAVGDDQRLLALMGTAQIRAGKPEDAVAMFRKRLADNPDSNTDRIGLANALLAAQRPAEAAEVLGELTGTDAERLPGELMMLTAQLRSGEDASARDQARRIESLAEGNSQVLGLIGSAFAGAGKLDDARGYFERLLEAEPGSVVAMRGLGRLAVAEGDMREAQARFEAALAQRPEDPDILLELAAIAEREGDPQRMEELLLQAAEAPDSGVRPKLLVAQWEIRQGKLSAASRHAEMALKDSPGNPDALNLLGLVSLAEGNHQLARTQFKQAIDDGNQSGTLYFNLARAEYASGDLKSARANLRSAVELAPDAMLPSAALVELELRAGDLPAARSALARLTAAHPEQPATLLLTADVAMAAGEYRRAASGYRDLAEKTGSRRATLGLYGAQKQLGDAEADRVLENWLEQNPEDTGVRLLLAQDRTQTGDESDAIRQYESIIEAQPDNGPALNNLAWLYAEAGDSRAVELAERAYTALPESGSVADTLGWALFKAGDRARAVQVLREAVQKAPADPTIRYHLAVALIETGETEEGSGLLVDLLKNPDAASLHADAQRLLDQVRKP